MQAKIFYDSNGSSAIPLYLITSSQWEEELNELSSFERNCFALHQFQGKLGDCCLIHNADGLLDKAYIGIGKGNQEQALAHAALVLPPNSYQLQCPLSNEAAMTWALAQYRFTDYKKHEAKPRLLAVDADKLNEILQLTQAHFLVRDLVNQPTSALGPKELAEMVERLAKTHQAQFKQWVGDELLSENYPAIHAVGRASKQAPRLISLVWGDERHPRVTLVGKGVCFDSGGLDIKPASGMRLMKKDMGGAAQVIGLAQWIMAFKLPIRLHMLIPAVENSIGPDSFRPGDVITMRNGLTVEVHNTDAEGRLVLADALVKACEEQPELLIDFATLTGAARVAVGTEIAAMFSNNDLLASAIMNASSKVADPIWRLPLFPAYEEILRSNVADIANASDQPYAGAIVGGLFLQRFISQNIPWLHFDIMAWNLCSKPGKPEGGEAMGFHAVAAYLQNVYGK